MAKTMKRREFVVRGSAAVLGAGLAFKGRLDASAKAGERSLVVQVTHPAAVLPERQVQLDPTRLLVREGMARLTGSKSPWAALLKPTDRVGLKINTLGRPLIFTHHELIRAFVEELKAFGIPEKNIIVWDRYESHMRDCKFEFNTTGEGCPVYGTDALDPNVRRYDPEVTYVSEVDKPGQRDANGTASLFSSIFTRDCDKVINLAILKDHGLSGYTLALKNLAYGLCNNNRRFHAPDCIGAFIAGFCAHPAVRSKVVLHVVDGLEGCYDQGPAPKNPKVIWPANTLWFSTDPVAVDTVCAKVIDEKRVAEGLPPVPESGRPWDHILQAAKLGLGNADPAGIRLEKKALG